MTMMSWGRGLTFWGLVAALAAVAPAVLLSFMPPELSAGFVGLVALLLTLSVAPIAAMVASVGVILLLLAVLRLGRE
jgi:hypothetical protein